MKLSKGRKLYDELVIHSNDHHGDTIPKTGKCMDVGIDSYFKLFGTYEPFSYEQILEIVNKK